MRIVITPATRAVAAATRGMAATGLAAPPMKWFVLSVWVPMMSGLSTTMYAIVKNVTSAPRISRATVEPRSWIRNQRSSAEVERSTSGAVVAMSSLSGRIFRPEGGRDVGNASMVTDVRHCPIRCPSAERDLGNPCCPPFPVGAPAGRRLRLYPSSAGLRRARLQLYRSCARPSRLETREPMGKAAEGGTEEQEPERKAEAGRTTGGVKL